MKVEVLVPTDLSEITLEQYRKFLKLEEEVDNSTTFFLQKVVEIFCEIDLKDIANIRYKSLVDVVQHIQELFNQENEFIPRFEMNGVEYGFIPVLDDITLGEYIDLDNYLSKRDDIHKAMAVMFRPITFSKNERYDIKEYNGTGDAYKYLHMPLNVALGAYVFFYHLNRELVTATLNCLEIQEMDSELKRTLGENGVGIQAYMHSLKGILQDLNISQNSKHTNV